MVSTYVMIPLAINSGELYDATPLFGSEGTSSVEGENLFASPRTPRLEADPWRLLQK